MGNAFFFFSFRYDIHQYVVLFNNKKMKKKKAINYWCNVIPKEIWECIWVGYIKALFSKYNDFFFNYMF